MLEEVRDFLKKDPYGFATEPDQDSYTFEYGTTRFDIVLHYKIETPFHRWSTILGDCVQNFRSCLDHAIVGAVTSRSYPKPPPSSGRLAFPICDSAAAFAAAKFRLGLLRHEPASVTAIEGLQPYSNPNPPYLPTFTLLRQLNDRDKHRELYVAAMRAANFGWVAEGFGPAVKDKGIYPLSWLEEGAKVAYMVFYAEPLEVKVYTNSGLYPAIGHRIALDPAADIGCPIDWPLIQFRDEVTRALGVVESLL